MKNEKQDYKIALQEAQELGYAEADPRFDVEGNDTAHKIVLLYISQPINFLIPL